MSNITKIIIGKREQRHDYTFNILKKDNQKISFKFTKNNKQINLNFAEKIYQKATKINILMINKNKNKKFISLENINPIFEFASQKPHLSKYSYVIVDNAQDINTAAQNKLLKIIEEPPKYLKILLLSENNENFLPTIKSRCEVIFLKKANSIEKNEYKTNNLKINQISLIKKNFILFLNTKSQIQAYKQLDKLVQSQKIYQDKLEIITIFTKIVNSYINTLIKKDFSNKKIIYLHNLINKLNKGIKANTNPKLLVDLIFLTFNKI